MGANTKIAWAHHTFNPWLGCTKISRGCENCYAEAWAKRFKKVQWGPRAARIMTSYTNWYKPIAWARAARDTDERHRVFCGSLCDVFEERPDLMRPRDALFDLIRETWSLDWLLLTKRPDVMAAYALQGSWPNNAWALTTVESREYIDRIDQLLTVPAPVRGLSVEPMLGPVDLFDNCRLGKIDWVIAGCESGPRRRQARLEWFRGLRDQCRAYNMKFFMKQIEVDGRVSTNPDDWPEDLRVQEIPS